MKNNQNEFLEIMAGAEGKKPTVNGMAYSGGKMRLPGWKYPVVVDLAGMSIAETVPLLADHNNSTASRVGMISAQVVENQLMISGEIVAESDLAAGIVDQGKSGADWQLSIGAEVQEAELVKGKAVVNGTEIEGPFYHVTRSTLREVSVVAVGADGSTKMKVSAAFKLTGEIETMNETEKNIQASAPQNETVPAAPAVNPPQQIQADADLGIKAAKAERERVLKIKSICSGEFGKIEAQAIEEGWTPEQTTEKVLAAYRAKQPVTQVNLSVKKNDGPTMKTLEAAMCLRAGISEDALVKDLGEQTVEAAYEDRDMPIRTLMCECMCLEGMDVPRHFDNSTIQAAFSTISLPGILSNVANKKLLQSYEAQPIIATKLCTSGDLNDFKEADRFRLTDMGDLLPVAADGEIKEGGLVEESAKNQIDTFAKKFCLTRKMIINDDLGAFLKVPVAMGNRAARLIDQLFFKRLLANPNQADGKALFHANHKNLLTGATSALSADSLKKAIQLYLDQVDADGQPIAVEPRYLVVPTALKHLAIELTRGATLIMAGGTDNVVKPALNVLSEENLQVVSSPYLANTAYDGASASAWYLFGQPGTVDTFEIGYLKGRRTPTVERGDLDFNVLGMWFRVFFDVGVREQDHRGMVKANGAA